MRDRHQRFYVTGGLFCLVFLAGWHASGILNAERLVIEGADGAFRVILGTDTMGGGFITVKDFSGSEVFAVRGKKVLINGQEVGGTAKAGRPTTSTGVRVAQLIAIQPVAVDPAVWGKIDSLRAEATELEGRARAAESREAYLRDAETKPSRRTGSRGIDYNEQRATLRKLSLELRKEAKSKTAEAVRLERDAEEPKQLIVCWDGESEVVLETTRDLSVQLDRIAKGGFLTWFGRRYGLDEGRATYRVSRIKPAERPADFTESD